MDQVRFCRHCGELLETQWMHCPWCGRAADDEADDWTSIIDASMERTETQAMRGRMGRLEDLSGRLDELESELDAFLAGKTEVV